MFTIFVRTITERRLFSIISQSMKGKRSKRSNGKKHQEDPVPLVISRRKHNERSRKEAEKSFAVDDLDRSVFPFSKAVQKYSAIDVIPESSGSSELTDYIGKQKKGKFQVGDISSNFWAKSKEKYQKISDKKRKKNLSESSESIDISDGKVDAEKKKSCLDGAGQQRTKADMVDDCILIDSDSFGDKMKSFKKKKKKSGKEKKETALSSVVDKEVKCQHIDSKQNSSQCTGEGLIEISDDNDDTTREDNSGQSFIDERLQGLKAFSTPCGVLMSMEANSEICFHGNCYVTLLCGSVSILGSNLKHLLRYDFYSPDTNSFLTFKCESVEDNLSVVKTVLKNYKAVISKREESTLTQSVAVIKLEYLDIAINGIIPQYPPFQQIFCREDNKTRRSPLQQLLYRIGLTVIEDGPRVMVPDEYSTVIDMAGHLINSCTDSPAVITAVGGKNSGKSTMNRYLVNSLLNKVDKLYFLECDVGQTELTPPGCISLHCITEPLLGPPFTHQRRPVYSCFFGGVTPADDPTRYLTCIEQCFSEYLDIGDISKPLIVNTMGWNKGVGLALTLDIIRLVRPLLLVQINTQKPMINFPAMSTEFVWNEPGWNGKVWDKEKWSFINDFLDFKWLSVNSPVNTAKSHITKYKPIEHRDLVILGYFCHGLDPDMTLTSEQPYTRPWNSVAIHVCHEIVENSEILYAINCTIVALCVADLSQAERDSEETPYFFKSTPVCQCLGFGIIQSIDPAKKTLHILTPLDIEELQKVNTILRGNINLPNQVLLKQKCEGEIPYVTNPVSSTGSLALRQRHMLPRKQPQGNNT